MEFRCKWADRVTREVGHSVCTSLRFKMASIVQNYTDLFVQNGLLELGAGIVTILIPSLFFSNSRSIPHATYIARWWAAAVIAIGSMSLLMSTCAYRLGVLRC